MSSFCIHLLYCCLYAVPPPPYRMPYADSPVPNLETTVNVDKFYHRHNSSLHASNPLVGQVFWEKCRPSTFSARTNGGSSKKGCFGAGTIGKPQPPIGSHANDPWGAREWNDTYGILVCNLNALRSPSLKPSPPASSYTLMSKSSFSTALATASAGDSSGSSSTNGGAGGNVSAGKKKLTEEQRLSIALLMSGGKDTNGMSDQEDFIYSPSHLVYDELCMILQTRYFRLVSADDAPKPESDASSDTLGIGGLNSVREISIGEYNASRTPGAIADALTAPIPPWWSARSVSAHAARPTPTCPFGSIFLRLRSLLARRQWSNASRGFEARPKCSTATNVRGHRCRPFHRCPSTPKR